MEKHSIQREEQVQWFQEKQSHHMVYSKNSFVKWNVAFLIKDLYFLQLIKTVLSLLFKEFSSLSTIRHTVNLPKNNPSRKLHAI